MKNILDRLNKFFGAVIAFNIFHQVASSTGYLSLDMPMLKILYLISLGIFGIELLLRVLAERRLSFLLSISSRLQNSKTCFFESYSRLTMSFSEILPSPSFDA